MREFLTSFRGRLTVLSLTTLAVALTAYSLIVGAFNLRSLSSHIDQDLQERARMAARGRPMPGGPPQGPEDANGPDQAPPGIGPRGGQDFVARRPLPGPRPNPDNIRLIDADGTVVNGPSGTGPFDSKLLQTSKAGGEGFSEATSNGEPIRVFSMPWPAPDGRLGVVQTARSLRDYNDLKKTQFWIWIALTPLCLAVSAAGALVLAGRALTPVRQMQEAAARVSQGDLTQRLDVKGDDELAHLAHTFNVMAANLKKSFEDKDAAYKSLQEAYESQKRFTADASHELRTPLARLQLATSSALRGPESEYRRALESADVAAKSMAKLIRELLTLARADAGQLGLRHEPLDLRIAVSNALSSVDREIQTAFPPGPLMVMGDEDHLERVFANLIENAVRHTPPDRPIQVSLGSHGREAMVSIADCGEGIPSEHMTHLFDRFYRVDPARARSDGGVGLGLAICKSVVEAHGGSISARSAVGKGTTFEVRLPARLDG